MGRFYPTDWLAVLIEILHDTGVEDFAHESEWLESEYLHPNLHKTLFEVQDYKPWLCHMNASLVQLKNDYPSLYEVLVKENSRVTVDVLKTAQSAAENGTHPYECIFTGNFDQVNYERLFNDRDYSHIYDTFVDMKDEVHWLEYVEYPIFVAWKVCRPQDSTGISFDNYVTVRSYVRDEIMELITTDERIVAKALGYDYPAWNTDEYVVEAIKQVDDKDVKREYVDVATEMSDSDSYDAISLGDSNWSDESTLVVE